MSPPPAQVFVSSAVAPQHELPGHFERPARVSVVLQSLKDANLVASAFPGQIHDVPAAKAPMEAVRRMHTYAEALEQRAAAHHAAGGDGVAPLEVADLGDPEGVTYMTPTTFHDALVASGAAIALVDAVVEASRGRGEPQGTAAAAAGTVAGISLTRPPGHHATADTPLGYCLVNSVALAARHAQQAHGLRKVLIFDFDLHHGNGTSALFAADPSVLFIDTHEERSIYPPPFVSGGVDNVGVGEGVGATINVPLAKFAGDDCVLLAFDEVVAPAARRFAPDIILVSAGFDAHWRDPFEALQFKDGTYYALTARLQQLASEMCGGQLVFVLEGGYCTEAVGASVCEVFRALLGLPSAAAGEQEPPRPEPLAEVQAMLQRVKEAHGLP